MNISFIYPSDPFDSKKVDEAFEAEYKAVKNFATTYLVNTDDISSTKLSVEALGDSILVYRGWMLTQESYTKLYEKTNQQLLVGPEEYLSNHHLPNWYDALSDLTAKSVITTEATAPQEFENLGWGQAFIKDYVKSLKTGVGSIVSSSEDVRRALEDMKKYRGFIEGGIVLRAVEKFKHESETRFFVVNGEVFAPNHNIVSGQLELAQKVAVRFNNKAFYSIDIATNIQGENQLVEIGDGQVSDLVGWKLTDFLKVLEKIKNEPKNSISLKKKLGSF